MFDLKVMLTARVQPKNENVLNMSHHQVIRDQVAFVSHQVCRNVSHQWMLCSEWVPSERESMDALQ